MYVLSALQRLLSLLLKLRRFQPLVSHGVSLERVLLPPRAHVLYRLTLSADLLEQEVMFVPQRVDLASHQVHVYLGVEALLSSVDLV